MWYIYLHTIYMFNFYIDTIQPYMYHSFNEYNHKHWTKCTRSQSYKNDRKYQYHIHTQELTRVLDRRPAFCVSQSGRHLSYYCKNNCPMYIHAAGWLKVDCYSVTFQERCNHFYQQQGKICSKCPLVAKPLDFISEISRDFKFHLNVHV